MLMLFNRLPVTRLLPVLFFSLCLGTSYSNAQTTTTLVPRGSVWKFNDQNIDLGTAWRDITYDDSAWGAGAGPLGGGDPHIVTTVNYGPSGARYPTVYYRKTFTVSSASGYQSLIVRLLRDDGAIVWLNGNLLLADGANPAGTHVDLATQTVDGANESTYFESTHTAAGLLEGTNVLAVASKQVAASSSDLGFDLEIVGTIDTTPPTVIAQDPAAGSIQTELKFVTVTFSKPVQGVNASDFLVNGVAATNYAIVDPREYTFYFPQPPTGQVQIAWAVNHGITDTTPLSNAFTGLGWSYTLDPNASAQPRVIISEFMTDNNAGIRDDDGAHSDWIELFNNGAVEVNLNGWFLTDSTNSPTQWTFPPVIIQPGKYLLVWASAKDHRNPLTPLHTNFKLAKNADSYLALLNPQTNVVSSFTYPVQQTDVSYGRDRVDQNLVGYFTTPTPGAQNSVSGPGFVPAPVLSVPGGIYTNNSVTVSVTVPTNSVLRYTLDGTVPTNTSAIYTGSFTFSTNTILKLRAFATNGTLFPSPVVVGNYIFVDDTSRNFTSRLPILIMNTGGRGIAASVAPGLPRTKGSFAVLDLHGGHSSLIEEPEYFGNAEFEVFGQTSAGFPKVPFNIELQDEFGNDREESLLGMPADADWKLRNPYSDKPLLMDYLAFELFGDMGHYSVRRRLVEVFVDTGGGKLTYPNDYYGVMVMVEKIEQGKDRVDIAKLTPAHTNEPAISGGYMFKKDKDSTGDLNFGTTGGAGFAGQALKIHEPKPREITTQQLAWLNNYLNKMEQALYSANWLTLTGTNHYSFYLDPDAFVDQFWIVEFPKQIDGYRLSDYFTKDRNGRVKPAPIWDWNLSFGNANYADGGHTNGWYYTQIDATAHIWARRLITGTTSPNGIGDPDFNQKIADRWAVLRTNVLNGPRLLARIDFLGGLLNEAAVRDFSKFPRLGQYVWPNPDGGFNGDPVPARSWDVDYQSPTTYPGIIAQMKKWVNGRYLWVDSQFTHVPTISVVDAMVTNGTSVTLSSQDGGTIYYTLDGTDPRAPGGNPAAGAQVYSTPININANVRLVARVLKAGAWQNTWSGPNASSVFTVVPGLRITEIMYHPAPPPAGSTNSADDFEYIEVKNESALPLNVGGYHLGGGIDFTFPTNTLAAGQSAVIVKNLAAFQSRYGSNILVLGTFTGNLGNDGDHLILEGSFKEPILDFTFNDTWNKVSDGLGFSLVPVNENEPQATYGLRANWRASGALGGSPGAADPAPPSLAGILVNEVFAGGLTNSLDAVELYNPTAASVNIGGWFLSDDFSTPRKYIFPQNTTIAARGYLTVDASQFNVGSNAFALGGNGDDIFVYAADGTNLLGYVHGFTFGESPTNRTIGRYVDSTGSEQFVIQATNSLGATNSGPLVGPVVITEVMYHPPDEAIGTNGYNNVDFEFIELQNISASAVPLYDTAYPTNQWHLRGGIDFDFPTNAVLPAGGYALVVSFDPVLYSALLADLRSRYGIPAGVPIYGPYSGDLDNDGDTIRLRRPEAPDPLTSEVVYWDADFVTYNDHLPWPMAADGLGLSLHRRNPAAFGNDPTNWVAAAPTPGSVFVGGTAPAITSQPGPQLIVVGSDVTFTATATGTAPLHYQWRYMGLDIPGATNATLVFTNFQLSQAGAYNIVVFNGGGAAVGTEFNVTSRIALQILQQPADRSVIAGRTTNFNVLAIGTGTLRYQWRKNNSPINGETNALLTLPNVQVADQGTYSVQITDDYESLTSSNAVLTIVSIPVITLDPISASVVEGGSVSLSVAATGTMPISFRWRRGGFTFTGGIINNTPSNSVLTLTNVTAAEYTGSAARFDVALTNIAGQASRLATAAIITVLADTDHDGLPDVWESSHPGFDPNNAADATRDDDSDGMNNRDEYIAGTDPLDPASVLRVTATGTNSAVIQFPAMSNHVYSVQYSDTLPAVWHKLTDVLAVKATNRVVTVEDAATATNRFYRIVTPVYQ